MKKILLACLFSINLFSFNTVNSCEVSLSNTEIRNPEFYIDFTRAVEKILISHGHTIVENNAEASLSSKNYITTGTNYFKLKQANIEIEVKLPSKTLVLHGMSKCFTVSCPASNYLKALKQALKELDQQVINCN